MDDRMKLIKTFWAIAQRIGKDNAYDVVESLYGHRSLRALTLDEFNVVVTELSRKSGFKIYPQKRKTLLTKEFFTGAGYQLRISDAQRKKISVLYDQSGVTLSHFLQILKHVAPEGYLGPKQAGKIIGALIDLINHPRSTRSQKNTAPPAKPKTGNKFEVNKDDIDFYHYYESKVGHC